MKKVILFSLVIALFAGCKKGAYETKPQITVKSLEPGVVPKGGLLRVILEYTDKEGDVSDSVYVFRERTNVRGRVIPGSFRFKIPDFPNEQKAEIQLDLDWSQQLTVQLTEIRIPGSTPVRYEPDTLNLKFIVVDKAKNRSDTAKTSVVVLR